VVTSRGVKVERNKKWKSLVTSRGVKVERNKKWKSVVTSRGVKVERNKMKSRKRKAPFRFR
jgi:SepF-like predicted cell division protein (DUF552 family)